MKHYKSGRLPGQPINITWSRTPVLLGSQWRHDRKCISDIVASVTNGGCRGCYQTVPALLLTAVLRRRTRTPIVSAVGWGSSKCTVCCKTSGRNIGNCHHLGSQPARCVRKAVRVKFCKIVGNWITTSCVLLFDLLGESVRDGLNRIGPRNWPFFCVAVLLIKTLLRHGWLLRKGKYCI